jgi:hypothetical protein
MAYTELDLAQAERRILAGERCVSRQKELLKRRIEARLPAEAALNLLAQFEATLLDLRQTRNQIRNELAAANTQRLMNLFWTLPASRGAYERPAATGSRY